MAASRSVVWGDRTPLAVADTGLINIPANPKREHIRVTNGITEPVYFIFGDFLPVFGEEIKLSIGETLLFDVSECGTTKIRFVSEVAKIVDIIYQEAE